MHKVVVGSVILVLCTLGWSASSVGQEAPAPRGELRIVDKHPANFAWMAYNVFEHLIEADKDGKLVPGLAVSWQWRDDRTLEVILRQGVKFHNGEVFDAAIVQLNWEENTRILKQHMPGSFLNFPAGSRLEIVDSQTVRFIFSTPDGGALAKLSNMHMANRQFYHELGWGEGRW